MNPVRTRIMRILAMCLLSALILSGCAHSHIVTAYQNGKKLGEWQFDNDNRDGLNSEGKRVCIFPADGIHLDSVWYQSGAFNAHVLRVPVVGAPVFKPPLFSPPVFKNDIITPSIESVWYRAGAVIAHSQGPGVMPAFVGKRGTWYQYNGGVLIQQCKATKIISPLNNGAMINNTILTQYCKEIAAVQQYNGNLVPHPAFPIAVVIPKSLEWLYYHTNGHHGDHSVTWVVGDITEVFIED